MARHPRIVLAALASFGSLASWGLGPIAARTPDGATLPGAGRLVAACEQALQARLPSPQGLKVAATARVEASGAGHVRLLGSFDTGGGRTSFACDLAEREGTYDVAALTLVQW